MPSLPKWSKPAGSLCETIQISPSSSGGIPCRNTETTKSLCAMTPLSAHVKSSVLSRAPDLAISVHLMTEAEIDEFLDDALAELEEIRIDAKKALAAAASH